ncbi:MAG: alanine racemase [Thermoplasmatota archaeon]
MRAGDVIRPAQTNGTLGPLVDAPAVSGTWIEIDAAALRHNLDVLRGELGDATLCMVVKGNAYGHGYRTVVPIAEGQGVRDFAVFSAREAASFYAASDGRSRLQVMGGGDPANLPWLLEKGAHIWLNDAADWDALQAAVAETGRTAHVHLELETGMNRTGVRPENALPIARAIHEHPDVHLEGVCTHLAGAEDPVNDDRLAAQRLRFAAFEEALRDAGVTWGSSHVASSAAALREPNGHHDLVRMGIACYGLWPSSHVLRARRALGDVPVLRPVLSWKSRVLATRFVADGDYVGYGRSHEAEGDQVVAVVAVGYGCLPEIAFEGDGFSRDLSNRGHVLIRGRRASIMGAVNMNMIQVHATHLPDVACGDEVVLIGAQGDEAISVGSFSDFNNVVNYELMARLSWEIPRIIRGDPEVGPP